MTATSPRQSHGSDATPATLSGVVTFAQESRFKLREVPGGAFRMIVLAHGAGIEPDDLPGLVGSTIGVEVEPSVPGGHLIARRVTVPAAGRG